MFVAPLHFAYDFFKLSSPSTCCERYSLKHQIHENWNMPMLPSTSWISTVINFSALDNAMDDRVAARVEELKQLSEEELCLQHPVLGREAIL